MPNFSSKYAYQKLVKPLIKLPTTQNVWEKLLTSVSIEWKKVYMLPRIATIESSLRSFQYRLMNNILYLNERLFKFDVVKSPLCSLRSLVNETVVHLLCECKETIRIWKRFKA